MATEQSGKQAAFTSNQPLWHGTNNTNVHDTISKVREFEQACGATLYPLGQVPPLDKLKLRLSLELEELYEKAQAMGLEGTFCELLIDRVHANKQEEYYAGHWVEQPSDTHNYDPVALLDACCDQRYVQDGTMLTCGLDAAFPEAFAEVQHSNMSKFCGTAVITAATEKKYAELGIPTVTIVHDNQGESMWRGVVKRASDGKILKSAYYSPADLVPIVAKYTA